MALDPQATGREMMKMIKQAKKNHLLKQDVSGCPNQCYL
jgi:dissimilatory sulfite reductase (desulfoviridin) alpha/beta subunit